MLSFLPRPPLTPWSMGLPATRNPARGLNNNPEMRILIWSAQKKNAPSTNHVGTTPPFLLDPLSRSSAQSSYLKQLGRYFHLVTVTDAFLFKIGWMAKY